MPHPSKQSLCFPLRTLRRLCVLCVQSLAFSLRSSAYAAFAVGTTCRMPAYFNGSSARSAASSGTFSDRPFAAPQPHARHVQRRKQRPLIPRNMHVANHHTARVFERNALLACPRNIFEHQTLQRTERPPPSLAPYHISLRRILRNTNWPPCGIPSRPGTEYRPPARWPAG